MEDHFESGKEPSTVVDVDEYMSQIEGNVNPFSAHAKEDDEVASIGDEAMEELHEHTILPVADEHGNKLSFPGEEEAGQGKLVDTEEKKDAPHSVIGSGIESLKYIYSIGLLLFSLVIVMAAIFSKQTVATGDKGLHPAIAFVVFWFLVSWLAMMEGGQGALVGLQPIDKARYAESHPRALKNTLLAHKGDNMERFIVGRQFLVVLVVFVTNMMASSIKEASVLGLSDSLTKVFLENGVAVILVVIMLGQLTAQINAANCMLDFINNYFMLFTNYVSLAIEASGLLHSVYLVQIFFSKLAGKPIESSEPPRDAGSKLLFWGRVIMSLTVLSYAFAVTLSALFKGQTKMWDGVPAVVSVVALFILMAFVGMMEGMQIALFAVVNMPADELAQYPIAAKNCQLTFSGQNLQAFLIGRQICVTCCMFIVARITSVDVSIDDATTTNIFGVSDGLQNFFNTGLLGAVITTIVASLMWRIIASSFPVAFLSNPLIYVIIRLCLLLEKSGVCSAAWVIARYHKPLVNYQPDEVHLEGAAPHTSEPVNRRDKDIDRLVTVFKFTYSMGLLGFALLLVMTAIFTKETVATGENNIHPILAFIIFWFLVCWLAMMEGGQGALVGLQPIEKSRYASTHPRALKCTTLAHKGDNMERFIVGRQFLVVLVVFVTNMMASIMKGSTLFLPDILAEIFLATGLAVILVVIMIGQLTAQVNAANCMLDFINNYFMLFTTYVSLAIEASGLLHSVYLVQMFFAGITGKPVESNEPPRSGFANVTFWARVGLSLAALGFSFAVTLAALFQGKTGMWEGVPEAVSVIVLFILMAFVGMMEGMQIALFAVVNMPQEELAQHSIAHTNCELTFRDQNLQAFLIGRQICVTICMFVVARITSIDVDTSGPDSDNIFGVSDGIQEFFNTGLLGAIITTIVASLAWRIIASSFPVAFLSNPLIYLIIRLCLTLESSGVCSAAWVLGRFHKTAVGYQPDDVYLEDAERHTSTPVTRRDKDIDVTVTVLKYAYSMGLLVFSVVVVMTGVFSEQTKVAKNVSPILAFCVIWGLVLWLGMMEGGQGCLVGLQPIDKELYKDSHIVSTKCTTLAHRGDNMERFIVGRQFLVVFVVFATNMCGSAIAGANVLGLSDIMTEIFLASGVAMIMMTLVLGQLVAQINAANCMLDFINNYFMLITTYVSLAIEKSGLLHSVYLVQIFFAKLTGKPIASNEPPRSDLGLLCFWLRVFFSLAVLGYSFAVTLSALFQGKTNIWEGVPAAVSVIVLFVLMAFVGMMEGMQIALFAVVNMPAEELANYPIAAKNCELTFKGNNLGAFLIGRQICVTCCMFVVARITSVNVDTAMDDAENIFGVSDGIQAFFNTGLLGAVITTIVASLMWRIIASSFPVAFLSNPLIYLIIRLCLILEASGLCSSAWLLALIHKQIIGYQLDEVYVGTQEERANAKKEREEMAQLKDVLSEEYA
jgi:Silicon transporter